MTTGRRWGRRGRDGGSTSVWLLGLCSVLGLAIVGALLLGSAAVLRHRAGAAADLAALAAAGAAAQGPEAACGQAARVVTGMAASLTSCRLVGLVAEIEVSVSADLLVVGRATAHGRARAGPVDADAAPP